MFLKHLRYQKYAIMAGLFVANVALSTLLFLYPDKWYAFLCILAPSTVINAASAFLIYGQKMCLTGPTLPPYRRENDGRRYLYIVPCYNETKEELAKALDALLEQRTVSGDQRAIIIVCDGHAVTAATLHEMLLLDVNGETFTTFDEISNHSSNHSSNMEKPPPLAYSYVPWDGYTNTITVTKGYYRHRRYLDSFLPCILLTKSRNIGKRDSLTLIRQVSYLYNQWTNGTITKLDVNMCGRWQYDMLAQLGVLYDDLPINYLIGIDADTVLDYNCSYELIRGIERDPLTQACVGYVDVAFGPANKPYHFLPLFQYAEYRFAQCLRRYAQSQLTEKVNCLSGCNQIMRITEETCGAKILSTFNRLPLPKENIFQHIRSYASEDRNHVCHLLSQSPLTKTTQTLLAIAKTTVPASWAVFMSQRRRWTLGAAVNDILLTYLPGINFWERVAAAVNLMTWSLAPFITVATVSLLKTIVENQMTTIFYYLCIPIIIPIVYSFFIPIFIFPSASFRDALYFYFARLVHLGTGTLVNLGIFFYALAYMDNLTWGKTRQELNVALFTTKSDHNEDQEIIKFYIPPPPPINNTVVEVEYADVDDVVVVVNDNISMKSTLSNTSYLVSHSPPFHGLAIMHIGICGYGFVGSAVHAFFEALNYQITIYDKYKAPYQKNLNLLLKTDLLFICLPTLFSETQSAYDMTEMDVTLAVLHAMNYAGYILIKSTVQPNYCINKNALYPFLKIMHNPEFLTARSAKEDFASQHHIVVGFTKETFTTEVTSAIKCFYQALFPSAHLSLVLADMAALMKLTCNAFYALKVQYFTEIYFTCKHLQLPFNELRELVLLNGWIHEKHTQVPGPDGQVSYGGLCFPKDVAALSSFLKHHGLPNALLHAAKEEQKRMR